VRQELHFLKFFSENLVNKSVNEMKITVLKFIGVIFLCFARSGGWAFFCKQH